MQYAFANGDTRTISLHHVHTSEDLTVTYKRNGRYDPQALKQINWLLRDWRRDEETETDPRLIDLLWEIQRKLGGAQPIHVICGYRAPETNAMLRRTSGGVAQFSQHTRGRAIDFFIPGVPLEDLRNMGLRAQQGGIGYYPGSGSPFVHLDVGDVRHWPSISREELARVFPDGRTVHVPSDGQPLPGYTLALADIERRGNQPSPLSLNAARMAGILNDDSAHHTERSSGNLLARLLGFGKSDDEKIETTGSIGGAAKLAAAKSRPPSKAIELAAASTASPPRAQTKPAWQQPVTLAKVTAAPLPLPASMGHEDASPQRALAYAPEAGSEWNTRLGEPPQPKTVPAFSMPAAAFIPAETSIAVKQPDGKPALVHTRDEIQLGEPFEDPWLRAAILAPNLREYMTATPIGTPDYRGLSEFMHKPSVSVTMAFSFDPTSSMAADYFSGRAVVFLAITAFNSRTAALLH